MICMKMGMFRRQQSVMVSKRQLAYFFQSGLTAMFIHHTGSSANMEEVLGDDVAAFPFPGGEASGLLWVIRETVIFESCENKAAAFEWYYSCNRGRTEDVV